MRHQSGKQAWPLFLIISGYLILRFLWAVLTPGGSWPMPPWHIVSMITDVALLIVLLVLNSNATGSFSEGDSRRTLQSFLFWFGVIAAVCLLLIRFTSDAAWWTGHL